LVRHCFITLTAVAMLHDCLLVCSPVSYAEWSPTLFSTELQRLPQSFINSHVLSSIHPSIHSSTIHLFGHSCEHLVLMCVDAVGVEKQVQADLTLELAPRRLSSCHFNDGAAHAPDVCLPAVPCLLDDLRSHPVGRPLHALVARVCRVQLDSHVVQFVFCAMLQSGIIALV